MVKSNPRNPRTAIPTNNDDSAACRHDWNFRRTIQIPVLWFSSTPLAIICRLAYNQVIKLADSSKIRITCTCTNVLSKPKNWPGKALEMHFAFLRNAKIPLGVGDGGGCIEAAKLCICQILPKCDSEIVLYI